MDGKSEEYRMNPDVRPGPPLAAGQQSSYSSPTPSIPRSFRTAFSKEFLPDYHKGTMAYSWRGVPCLKDPIDLALYLKLIYEMKPGSIIEIGTFHGGSALLFADIAQLFGAPSAIVTVDFRNLHELNDSRITFLQADALYLERSQLHALLNDLPRPWLIIEDSAHTGDVTYAVIDYFASRMISGEVLIIEDGVIEDQGANGRYHGGPNHAVSRFFDANPNVFRVMTEYTDFFGKNATFNPNGYLQRL